MNFKKCKFSKCGKLLSLCKNPVKGCCCEEHVKLAKQEYNEKYYQQSKQNSKIVKHAYIFKTCIDQFGEGAEIDASFLHLLGMDWHFETHSVAINNIDYIAIGNYAYIISKNQKIKIKRL